MSFTVGDHVGITFPIGTKYGTITEILQDNRAVVEVGKGQHMVVEEDRLVLVEVENTVLSFLDTQPWWNEGGATYE